MRRKSGYLFLMCTLYSFFKVFEHRNVLDIWIFGTNIFRKTKIERERERESESTGRRKNESLDEFCQSESSSFASNVFSCETLRSK